MQRRSYKNDKLNIIVKLKMLALIFFSSRILQILEMSLIPYYMLVFRVLQGDTSFHFHSYINHPLSYFHTTTSKFHFSSSPYIYTQIYQSIYLSIYI